MSEQLSTTDEAPRTSRRTVVGERMTIGALAVLTGSLVGAVGMQPTAIPLVDFVYSAAAAMLLVLAGGRAGRQAMIAGAVLALWVAPDSSGRLLAMVAVALGVWMAVSGRRRWAGAAMAGLCALVLSDLGAGPFQGSTALFSLIVSTPILVSAVSHVVAGTRRALLATATTFLAFAGVATMIFVAVGAVSAADVRSAIQEARSGFDVASDGDETAAAAHFDRAEADFESARRRFAGIWMAPARLVPIVGQHLKAVQVLTSQGTNLTATAADTTRAADLERIRLADGRLDLTVLDELSPVLDRADRAITAALTRISDIESEWLVPVFARRVDDLTSQLVSAQPAAHTAALAAAHVPTMLGAKQPVRWLVLLTTPAEARGMGGLVGNYALVTADDGGLSITESGRNEDLNRMLADNNAVLHGPQQYLDRWAAYTPERFFQDVTLAPDLPSVASVASDLYRQATGRSVDGVITIDPFAVGALLELTGPIDVIDRRFTPESAVEFLISGQYIEFADNEVARVLLLDGLVNEAFSALTSAELLGPRQIAKEFGPLVEQDRLGMWWAGGDGPTDLISAAGLDAGFPSPDGADLIAVVHQNAGQNKIDPFLDRSIDYRLEIEAGRAAGTITVDLANSAPSSGLPAAIIGSNDQGYPFGTNVALVSVHTALPFVGARVDGLDTPAQRAVAFGGETATLLVEIPPGATRRIEIDVAGRLASDDYRLVLVQQPLVNSDTYRVRVVVDGRNVIDRTEFPLLADTVIASD